MRLLSNVILRELSREGRILSLLVEIEDRPGLLARIATLVGEAGGNILEVSHNRMITDMSAKLADLGMTIEARDVGPCRRNPPDAAGRRLHDPRLLAEQRPLARYPFTAFLQASVSGSMS